MKLNRHYYCLRAIEEIGTGKRRKVRCRCQCGKIKDVRRDHLITAHTKSCGCLSSRLNRIRRKTKDVALVRLAGGGVAIIDQADEPLVADYHWKKNPKTGYVFAYETDGTAVYLHRLILGRQLHSGLVTSHVDWDKQNCTRANLKAVTVSQNVLNWKRGLGKSGYRGVSAMRDRWRATIYHGRQRIHIGYFDNPKTAAKAYDKEARELRGPDARTNFPLPRKVTT